MTRDGFLNGKKLVLACFAVVAGIALLGCIQQDFPPSAPTVTVGAGFPEREKNPLVLTRLEDGQENDFSVRVISPTKFELTATVSAGSPCSETTAYWSPGFDNLKVYFEHKQPEGANCIQVLETRTFSTVVDYSAVVALRPFKKVEAYDFNELVGEKKFEGMFCGGIAAFQCPYAFYCVLDGNYPDAGGACVFNANVYDGPRPA
ncbi:MAG: hypothetical protein QXR53_02050 [Candidatus Norongarragalinales archaeon]